MRQETLKYWFIWLLTLMADRVKEDFTLLSRCATLGDGDLLKTKWKGITTCKVSLKKMG